MVCTRWEREGLLFTSGELTAEEKGAFEDHLSTCESCRSELETYRAEKKEYFSLDILGAAPSGAVDKEIIRICSRTKNPVVGAGLISLMVRKSAVAVLLLLLGFGGGFYIAYNTGTLKDNSSVTDIRNSGNDIPEEHLPPAVSDERVVIEHNADTLETDPDAVKQRPFPERRREQPLQGAVPVDLQKKQQ